MANIYHGVRRPILDHKDKKKSIKVSNAEYRIIADALRAFALEMDLIPCQMQGVLWQTWRRIHHILTPMQQELWDRDFFAAGLGFVCS